MDENSIKIINTSSHKNLTDTHLAQINFTAEMPKTLFMKYINKTRHDHQNLGRIRFMNRDEDGSHDPELKPITVRVFGRVSHGYGYGIEQDIFNAIMDSKGIK